MSVQRAVDRLGADELVVKERPGAYRIAEPFLSEWVLRFGRRSERDAARRAG